MIVGRYRKQPSEEFPVSITFAAELTGAETVASCVVTVRNANTGADTAAVILDGAHSVVSPLVIQAIKGGVHEDLHILTMLATTSLGHMWEGEIEITVRED